MKEIKNITASDRSGADLRSLSLALVFPKDLAQAPRDLAHGGAAVDRLQDRRHQVPGRAGLLGDPAESRIPANRITPRTQGAYALDLSPFRRLVDILTRQGREILALPAWRRKRRRLAGEAVDADHNRFSGFDGLLVAVG